ncbi:MAG: chromosomal replication initiator protein DnaA [Nitrospirae bacterium]|nr:chromosomal replication initiator protein DnaA [Nitrospirota bacterium]
MRGVSDIWAESLEIIRKRVNPQAFHTWFSSVSLFHVDDSVCTVAVPNAFFIEMMAEPYAALIRETVGSVVARAMDRVDFVVADIPAQPLEREAVATSPAAVPVGDSGGKPLGATERRSRQQAYLNPKYTFDQFVVGAGNQFAHAAAQAVADNPAKAYNPLFIYGDVGLGKTHLLHAIGTRIRRNNPAARICYVSSEQFTNEVINSIRYDRMVDFRARYRNVDVLIIDDIQFISGKDRTQEEFFHTFNTLYEAHRQIVLSSDRFPKQMPDIEERLRSRFEWGLIADIQPPDLETKIAILEKKAELEGINLPPDVSMLLATHIKSNVRELEGALIRLGAYASLTGREITVDLARQNLRDLIKETHRVLSPDDIQQAVARHFHVKVADLKAKKRTKELVLPRQVAMFLCRQLTERSFPDIGRGFGGRDHTTVMHACRQVEKQIAADVGLRSIVDQLAQGLTEGG